MAQQQQLNKVPVLLSLLDKDEPQLCVMFAALMPRLFTLHNDAHAFGLKHFHCLHSFTGRHITDSLKVCLLLEMYFVIMD